MFLLQHRLRLIGLLLIASVAFSSSLRAQAPSPSAAASQEPFDLRDHSHILIIANSEYGPSWNDLPGAKSDLAVLTLLFDKLGYQVTTKENLSSRALKQALSEFLLLYGADPEARLILYYIGHGETLTNAQGGEPVGYVVPIDAPDPKTNRSAFAATAIPLIQFKTLAQQLDARQVLFVFDSCFAGTIFSATRGRPTPMPPERRYMPSRMVLTAGGAEQTVADYSLFRRAIVEGLETGAADADRNGYVGGSELGDYVRRQVVDIGKDAGQAPEWGHITGTPSAGEFLVAAVTPSLTSSSVATGPVEACNGVDDDEDGRIDEGFDYDRDGHLSLGLCGPILGDDCDDTQTAVHPGVPDLLDLVDADCDGYLDEDAEDYNLNGIPDHLERIYKPYRRRSITYGLLSTAMLAGATLAAGGAYEAYSYATTVSGVWTESERRRFALSSTASGVLLAASGITLSATIRFGHNGREAKREVLPLGPAPRAALFPATGTPGSKNERERNSGGL